DFRQLIHYLWISISGFESLGGNQTFQPLPSERVSPVACARPEMSLHSAPIMGHQICSVNFGPSRARQCRSSALCLSCPCKLHLASSACITLNLHSGIM